MIDKRQHTTKRNNPRTRRYIEVHPKLGYVLFAAEDLYYLYRWITSISKKEKKTVVKIESSLNLKSESEICFFFFDLDWPLDLDLALFLLWICLP